MERQGSEGIYILHKEGSVKANLPYRLVVAFFGPEDPLGSFLEEPSFPLAASFLFIPEELPSPLVAKLPVSGSLALESHCASEGWLELAACTGSRLPLV